MNATKLIRKMLLLALLLIAVAITMENQEEKFNNTVEKIEDIGKIEDIEAKNDQEEQFNRTVEKNEDIGKIEDIEDKNDLENKIQNQFTLEPTSHKSMFSNENDVENILNGDNLLNCDETESIKNRKRRRHNNQTSINQEDMKNLNNVSQKEYNKKFQEQNSKDNQQKHYSDKIHNKMESVLNIFSNLSVRNDKTSLNLDENKNTQLRPEYNKEYREIYAGTMKEYKKQYYETHADKIKEYKKQYYETHRDIIKEYQKKYREQNAKKIKECNKKYQEQNAEKLKEYQKEYHEQMQKREQILQNTFNNKDPDQIINTIIESEGHCNLKLLMMNSKNDPNKQEQMNFLLQILKENPILQDKIIEHLKNKRVNYCGDKIFYIVQLFETDETNYGLKYKRSKELFEYLKICPYFFRYNRDFETQMKSFLFYIKKLLMEEDFRALLLSHKYFYLDDQLQSFRILENFVEKNDKILTQKYFDILANDPEMENWIVKLFQTRTNSQKFLFFEAIKQNQIEIVQIILNFFVNYCSKNENFEILIKMLDDPYSMSLEKMPVLPFTIKQKNMRMAKLLMETMLKIPNYKLKNLIMLDDQTIIQSSNFDLITMPIAFLEMLNKANSDVEKFITNTEVYMILREHDIKKNLKLLQLPDAVTKWNLIRLCFMMKSRNKLADKI